MSPRAAFAAGGASMLGLVAVARRRKDGLVRFERRHGVLLLAVAVWNVLTFG